MYLLNRENATNAFPVWTDIINFKLIGNQLKDILRYQNIDCYALHTSTTKNGFSKNVFLSVLHDHTSVASL